MQDTIPPDERSDAGSRKPAVRDTGRAGPFLRHITIACGLAAAATATTALIGLASGITVLASLAPGYRAIPFSAGLFWIFLGLVLAYNAVRPFSRRSIFAIRIVLAGITIVEAIEIPISIAGSHSAMESAFIAAGNALLGQSTTGISPVASGLIILASLALFILLSPAGTRNQDRQIGDLAGITGLSVALIAFTFVMGYAYGVPLLYNSSVIPIAFMSALAGLFIGAAIIAAAGPDAIPVRYFTGSLTRARLLRIFVPLVVILTFVQNIIFFVIADVLRIQNALFLSISIVVFASVTAWVIAPLSGRIGSDLDRAERSLMQ